MPRVIAGSRGSRRISAPKGSETRPTGDRVRAAVFSTLYSLTELEGAVVMDLYAGSGAVGLEALSRGAEQAVFVEKSRNALTALRTNISELDFLENCKVIPGDVETWLSTAASAKDFVYLDPPYARSVHRDLALLVENGWLSRNAVVAVERASRDTPVEWPEGLQPIKVRRYGITSIFYARFGG
ncbi:16S rRNA (guanine(966)-N(2))-methyltransferase RsmD [Streptomyces acidicola]|uniref:16S rRNA (guanine(966)-N(2))-methyltransferase RsmD n=1 Tax=Streptomyces acidicola TaxID=2596892 RepID=UPI0037B43B3D